MVWFYKFIEFSALICCLIGAADSSSNNGVVSYKSEFAKISSLRDLQDKACEMKARIAELEQQLGRGDSNSSKNPKDYRKDFQGYRVGDLRDACYILKTHIMTLEEELVSSVSNKKSSSNTPSASMLNFPLSSSMDSSAVGAKKSIPSIANPY
ncbi:MAG: hypothetical protein KBD04_05375 [Proteobacteria bacterium]|nr:hypothetical protein [Pseudomonadota bacterium]